MARQQQRAKALIAGRIIRLANGFRGDTKPVGKGIRELRIHHGPGYRVYYKEVGVEIIIFSDRDRRYG